MMTCWQSLLYRSRIQDVLNMVLEVTGSNKFYFTGKSCNISIQTPVILNINQSNLHAGFMTAAFCTASNVNN